MKVRVFSCLLWALASSTALAQTAPDKAMDGILQHAEARPLAALAAVKLQNGQPVYQYYGGFARMVGGHAQPVQADTLFRIASISKVVTTLGLMELVERHKVDLDHDASDYLGFTLRNPDYPQTPITVRMLLNHTSSVRDGETYTLPPGKNIQSFFESSHKRGSVDYHFSDHDGHAPGTYFQYCNLCYGLVGTIIERVSGERFDQYQKRHVLDPLHIDGGYNVAELAHPERVATLYQHLPSGFEAQVDAPPLKGWGTEALSKYKIGSNGSIFSPQGGLRISLQGLTRLAQLMIQRGTLEGQRLVSPQTIAAMETPTWQAQGANGICPYPLSAYGLSLFRLNGSKDINDKLDSPYPNFKGTLYGHLGDAYGLHSGFWYNPQTGDAYLFAMDGYPDYDQEKRGNISSFSLAEEKVFETLAGVKP